ncbi:hypothetical protein D9756_003214 [Leucocoprinus leucothites]|uniref:Uncharacterized protein n=1 Tax=Leucocoprinus leucothites TaxID=201217 RepID=A0A8H5G6T2_9AGAR|nr:hypothetical protein D9756_003214 [Leucoagaricus leucothites]
MSSFLRTLAKSSITTARTVTRQYTPIRSFHSPFVVLGQARATNKVSQGEAQQQQQNSPMTYEKQYDFSYEPLTTSFGNRTYVVSQPDASASHYEVPSGAYPTSSPYVNYAPASEGPNYKGAQVSSTSTNLLAHEFTTGAVPRHFGGVGASSAIRHAKAPGEMDEKGGSFGGMGLMDWKGYVAPKEELGERNPPPDGKGVAEKYSKAGLDEAWKLRK